MLSLDKLFPCCSLKRVGVVGRVGAQKNTVAFAGGWPAAVCPEGQQGAL